ncbi:ATP-dependent nuclease [Clostridium perfringens]
MFISELTIINFKGFNSSKTIKFSDGINVLIGQNNAGKTTIIEALRLLFDINKNKSLKVEDFNRNQDINNLKKEPPKIVISAKLVESENEDEYSDDLVTVCSWLNKIDKPYEATITYEFLLPEKEKLSYLDVMKSIEENQINEYWDLLENNFIKKYVSKVYVGNPIYKNTLDSESIKKFDFQFLDAIRDVERDLFTGKNTLLKEVIDFFMDYEIKTDSKLDDKGKKEEIKKLKKDFMSKSSEIVSILHSRMKCGKEEMLKYVDSTGASLGNGKPDFDGRILDTELYSALKLIIEDKTGIKLPITQNGLGYNNLIYISLLLAKMQKNSSDEYLGANAKVYSILALEEPEAHLHPSMQYKFLKFLNKNKGKEVRQIFISSHSPNITAAVDIDDLIILGTDENDEITVAYPGKVFDDTDEDINSKEYVKRFIDVTKADMFFANGIILVEGIAEQLLLPEFAKLLDSDLIDKHISVINVSGRYFKHFLKLFDIEKSKYAINKKVACITDLDPIRKLKKCDKKELGEDKEKEENSSKACLPLFLDCDNKKYDYKYCSNNFVGESTSSNIKIFSQEKGKSCTFEYDIILSNPTFTDLVTKSVSNNKEIQKMMTALKEDKSLDDILKIIRMRSEFSKELNENIESLKLRFEKNELIKQIIASRYLKSINKGEVAQELVCVVSKQIRKKEDGEDIELEVPKYISEAIEWVY